MEPNRKAPRSTLLGKHAPSGMPMRTLGFPAPLVEPIFLWQDDTELKAHPRYPDAKAGDSYAAIELIAEIAEPLKRQVADVAFAEGWPEPLIFVAPHAREARGDNAIPQVLAVSLSIGYGEVDENIVQTTKVYHTGADAMERLIARASFQGPVQRGGNYVLVDDVTTLGGTLCDLSDYIRRNGGNVIAAVVLVNASRSGKLFPARKIVRRLEEQFGHVIRETFRIEPTALTADEAQYLVGFRTAEEIRGRSAKAKQTTNLRLRSKGIFFDRSRATPRQGAVKRAHRVPFPGASAVRSGRWIKKRPR
ncbi:phosphoribosyltransferase [Burkholderia pseudomallei]|uniref:phosphoribosyltransferase n=2 Tax=Burkholderia pseudomallei TaxID=28450 RepID=UPI00351C30C4